MRKLYYNLLWVSELRWFKTGTSVSVRSLRLIGCRCEPLHLSPCCFSLRLHWPHHLLTQRRVEQRLIPLCSSFMPVWTIQRRWGYFIDALYLMWQFTIVLETPAAAMGAFGVIIGILQYAGLCIQLNAALNVGHSEVDNHISGNGKFLCSCL